MTCALNFNLPPLLPYPLISGSLPGWVEGRVSLWVSRLAGLFRNADKEICKVPGEGFFPDYFPALREQKLHINPSWQHPREGLRHHTHIVSVTFCPSCPRATG